MRKFLIVFLIAINSASAFPQQGKVDSASIQSKRVEKLKPEMKSGTWVAGKIAPSSTQTYDNADNLVESIVYKGDGDLYVKYAAKFNDAGIKVEDTYFDAKGAVWRKTIYQYDANKKLIGKLYFDSKNSAFGETAIRYKAGRINERITYDTMGVVKSKTVYTYYDGERKLERRRYGFAGFTGSETLIFDERGRLKEINSSEQDASEGDRSLYQYDNDGYVTERVLSIGIDTVTLRYSYEFDSHGKWVKRIISLVSNGSNEPNPKPIDITKRTFSYGAQAGKEKPSTTWSLAQYVAEEVAESVWNGYILKRDAPTSKLSNKRLRGQAKVFVLVNEVGKVILAIPYGRLTETVVKVSTDKVRNIIENTIKDWEYAPSVLDGQPLLVTAIVNFNFGLR